MKTDIYKKTVRLLGKSNADGVKRFCDAFGLSGKGTHSFSHLDPKTGKLVTEEHVIK